MIFISTSEGRGFDRARRFGDSCPAGLILNNEAGSKEIGSCGLYPKNLGLQQCSMTPRPINITTGNKFYKITDYQGSGTYPISISRFYNSFTGQWTWNYQQKIVVTSATPRVAILHRPDGKQYSFTETNGVWQGDPGSTSHLVNDGLGFKLGLPDDTTESYDANGRLTNITNRSGLAHTLVYEINQITINSANESLVLSLDGNGKITAVNAGANQQYRYQYNAAGLLTYISKPDATPNQSGLNPFGEDNPYQTIHYENAAYPDHVTGITDENGNRTSTVQYDAQGQAISSEIANGIGKTTLDYSQMDTVDSRITVTNELGKQTTYHYTTIHGVRKVAQVEGHQSANCAAANQSYTYDANGFKDLVTDWEGNVTDYDQDARGLEVQRIEAKGTAQERVITTQWHPDFRLPTKIIEPDRVIDFSYDAQGLLLERKETPTP